MQCAIDAAALGHQVTLLEQAPELGGLLNIACKPPGKEQIRLFCDYLVRQTHRSSVEVKVNTSGDRDRIRALVPDAVVVATGSRPDTAGIVSENEGVFSVEDVLRGKPLNGKSILVIGGGQVGCEVAECLALQGRAVTVLEVLEDVASTMENASRIYLKMQLQELKVKIRPHTRVLKAHAKGVLTDGDPSELRADAVVLAVGYVPRRELFTELVQEGLEVYAIGDCVQPRRIYEAIHEGANLARRLGQ
jgi:pyruvate/2-oxoglutarate dehydrogenase complex dihydrolipoamide dehydrogenase (E3) component